MSFNAVLHCLCLLLSFHQMHECYNKKICCFLCDYCCIKCCSYFVNIKLKSFAAKEPLLQHDNMNINTMNVNGNNNDDDIEYIISGEQEIVEQSHNFQTSSVRMDDLDDVTRAGKKTTITEYDETETEVEIDD